MAIGKEERKHPRVEVNWPVVVMTSHGPMEGETHNLSKSGSFIRCPEVPELAESFRIVLKPPEGQILLATARVVWSDSFISDKSMFYGMGVSFVYIFDDDRQYLSRVVSDQL
jgi:hypothetical protein